VTLREVTLKRERAHGIAEKWAVLYGLEIGFWVVMGRRLTCNILLRRSDMTTRKRALTIFAVILSLLLLSAGSAFSAANEEDCLALKGYVGGLTDETLHQPVTNVTATWREAAGTMPEYCEVRGTIFP